MKRWGQDTGKVGWWLGFGLCALVGIAVLPRPEARAVERVREGSGKPEAALPADPAAVLREAPRPLAPALAGVGRLAPDVSVTDLSGKTRPLSALMGTKGLVIALVSSSCPVAQKIAPALGRLEADAAAKGFGVLYLCPIATDTAADLKKKAGTAGWKAPVVRDSKGAIAAALGATSTTEVFVLDAARTIVYRGAVSDQYGPTWAKDAPTANYLTDALNAIAAGEKPAISATTAPGCLLAVDAPATPTSAVTYHSRISRIMQTHCVDCHRTGGGRAVLAGEVRRRDSARRDDCHGGRGRADAAMVCCADEGRRGEGRTYAVGQRPPDAGH